MRVFQNDGMDVKKVLKVINSELTPKGVFACHTIERWVKPLMNVCVLVSLGRGILVDKYLMKVYLIKSLISVEIYLRGIFPNWTVKH